MVEIKIDEKNVVAKKLITLNSKLSDKNAVIQFIAENAENNGYAADSETLTQAVQKREGELSTAIGYSIAMPHGKTEAVLHPFIAFLRTAKEFQWTETSEEKVQLIFLIGVPKGKQEKLHLKFISQLSKKLLDEDFRNQLLNETKIESIYELLSSIDIKEE